MKRALSVCCAALAVAVGGAAAAALAADEPAKPSDCAFVRTIDRWAVIDERTMILETPAGRRFKVTFTSSCPDLKRARVIRLDPRPSSAVCLQPGDTLVFSRNVFPSGAPGSQDSCMIKKIEGVPPPEPAKDAPPPN